MKKLIPLVVVLLSFLSTIPAGTQTPLTANSLGQVQMPPHTFLGNALGVTGPLNAIPFTSLPGTGTVTSVGVTVPTGLAVSGSPLTTSGIIALSWAGTIPPAQIPQFSGFINGGVPASGGGTTNFLRADGTWAAPPGGGGGGTPGGVSGNVQTNNGAGGFNGITNTQLTTLVGLYTATLSGAVPASGGGSTNFLRADGTWSAPPSTPPGGTNGQVQVNLGGAFGGLTNTQLTADINTFTNTLSGAVPPSGGGTNFLRADGTWQTPAGGGNVSTSGTITSGNCAQFNSATTVISTGAPCGSGGGGGGTFPYVSIATYGATGDGTCHPLSGVYATLAAAQAVYPFVSDLTQCLDWAATQKAINVAFASSPTNASAQVFCPAGNYVLSNPIFFDQANNSQGSFSAWAVGTTYGNGANVTYNGIPWVSLGSGNVGNPPTSSSGFPASLNYVNTAGYPVGPVTISNASPAVFTIAPTFNSLVANQPIVFSAQLYAVPPSGGAPALPTGVNANQVYYVIGGSINVSAGTFQVSATPGGAAINTSSAGVGVFTANTQVWQVAQQAGSSFSNHISFVGNENIAGSNQGGCQFTTAAFNTGTIYLGPQQGNYVANINLKQQFPGFAYRCTRLGNSWGWVTVDNNGGPSQSMFERIGASGFYADFVVGAGNGSLGDSNTWVKSVFSDACIGIVWNETQAFINTLYDSSISNVTTGLKADLVNGVKVIGGNMSTPSAIATSFAITSPTLTSNSNNYYLNATITALDQFVNATTCSSNAGYRFNNYFVPYGNPFPYGNSCGYNIFTIPTAHYGIVPFYVVGMNSVTKVITLEIPQTFFGIYENTCCDAEFTTEIQAATKLYAAEMVNPWFGQVQVDTNHVEQDGVPTTLICNCSGFNTSRVATLNNVYLNASVATALSACCNQTYTNQPPTDASLAQFYAQQTTPFITAFSGDIIIDGMSGGVNLGLGPYATLLTPGDRGLIGTNPDSYVEFRHTGYNNQLPQFDFQTGNQAIWTSVSGQVNKQLSGGYFANGGAALGGGKFDNATLLVSPNFNALDFTSTGEVIAIPDFWRSRGWGQSPMWGVRPAPTASPCITPAQRTSIATPPAITFISQLKYYLNVTAGGSGYNVGDVITLAGGTHAAGAAQVTVETVSGTAVTSVKVTNGGAYTVEATSFTQASTSGIGTGATFNAPMWYVNYNIPYPVLWAGEVYRSCDFQAANFGVAGQYHVVQAGVGYSYFQNLTTTNVPNLSWSVEAQSPFVYMNQEALQLMFPGLVFTLTGTGGCSGTQTLMVLEVHPVSYDQATAKGYVKVVNAGQDGTPWLPNWGTSGTICTGTTIGQAGPSLTTF